MQNKELTLARSGSGSAIVAFNPFISIIAKKLKQRKEKIIDKQYDTYKSVNPVRLQVFLGLQGKKEKKS